MLRVKKPYKLFASEKQDYNWFFNTETGFFLRWGKTLQDDPKFAPFPELLDIEITTQCGGMCPECYKGASLSGKNMSFDTFKKIFSKLPLESLTQIAFGVDSSCTSNPDSFKIFEYCREMGVIPNVTVANISEDTAHKLSNVCGAVAVSYHQSRGMCYDNIQCLVDQGMKQVNMHFCLHHGNLEIFREVLQDVKEDPRLSGLNSIIILSLKQKGRGIHLCPVKGKEFGELAQDLLAMDISFGFDSCTAHKFLNSIHDLELREKYSSTVEPCESTLFSGYINVEGKFFPCSFLENEEGWTDGLSVLDAQDFVRDIWQHPRVEEFRQRLLQNERRCPCFLI